LHHTYETERCYVTLWVETIAPNFLASDDFCCHVQFPIFFTLLHFGITLKIVYRPLPQTVCISRRRKRRKARERERERELEQRGKGSYTRSVARSKTFHGVNITGWECWELLSAHRYACRKEIILVLFMYTVSGLLPVWCEELGRLLMLRHDPGKSRPLPNHATTTINAPVAASSMTAGAAAATMWVCVDYCWVSILLIPLIGPISISL